MNMSQNSDLSSSKITNSREETCSELKLHLLPSLPTHLPNTVIDMLDIIHHPVLKNMMMDNMQNLFD
jgi:hypothetical protein